MDNEYNLELDCETGEFTGRKTVTVDDTSVTALGRGETIDEAISNIDAEITKAGGNVS